MAIIMILVMAGILIVEGMWERLIHRRRPHDDADDAHRRLMREIRRHDHR